MVQKPLFVENPQRKGVKVNGPQTLHSPAQRPVRFYSSLSGPLLLDSKFPFSWWPKKGDWRILVCSRWTPGIPRDGYRTQLKKARFELMLMIKIIDNWKIPQEEFKAVEENLHSEITENSAEKSIQSIVVLKQKLLMTAY